MLRVPPTMLLALIMLTVRAIAVRQRVAGVAAVTRAATVRAALAAV